VTTVRRYLLIALGVVLALVVAYFAGRFSAPVKVEERVKVETKVQTVTEWKERIVYVQDQHRKATTTTTKEPGGKVVIVKVEETETDTKAATDGSGQTHATAETKSEASKVTTSDRPGWRAGLAATWDMHAPTARPGAYGLELDRRLFGTLWLGVRADTDRRVGAALSLEW
jgi:hypothetical protein